MCPSPRPCAPAPWMEVSAAHHMAWPLAAQSGRGAEYSLHPSVFRPVLSTSQCQCLITKHLVKEMWETGHTGAPSPCVSGLPQEEACSSLPEHKTLKCAHTVTNCSLGEHTAALVGCPRKLCMYACVGMLQLLCFVFLVTQLPVIFT